MGRGRTAAPQPVSPQPAPSGSAAASSPDASDFLPPKFRKKRVDHAVSDFLPPSPKSQPAAAAPTPSINDLLPPTERLTPRSEPPERAPAIDSLLPPGFVANETARTDSAAPAPGIDALLPPGAADGLAISTGAPATAAPASALDALLPPGAGEMTAAVPGEQVAIPAAPKRSPTRHLNLPENAIVVPNPEGGFVTIAETPKTVGEGEDVVEIRRLSSEEKAKRRFRKNLILGGFCLAILVVVLVIMLW
jgi:hypothetical protein